MNPKVISSTSLADHAGGLFVPQAHATSCVVVKGVTVHSFPIHKQQPSRTLHFISATTFLPIRYYLLHLSALTSLYYISTHLLFIIIYQQPQGNSICIERTLHLESSTPQTLSYGLDPSPWWMYNILSARLISASSKLQSPGMLT